MATKNVKWPTLLDVASRSGSDGKIQAVAEVLSETNDVAEDMVMVEANDGTNHKTTVRTGLPKGTWRMLNYGVQPTKSRTAQVSDSTGMLEAYAEVDKDLADLNGNTSEFRLSEDRAHIEGMNQSFCEMLFYGNTKVTPKGFTGLAARYSDKSAESGRNIIDAGGTGADLTSIYLVVWSPNTVHGIYPKGSQGGLKHQDKGQVTLEDADGGKYEGYRSHYKWDCGLTVRDWRYVVRIANIKVSALTKDFATGPDLADLMIQARAKVPSLKAGRAAFYANDVVSSFLERQVLNKENVMLKTDEVSGDPVTKFGVIPVRRVDAILNTETQVL